MRLRLLFRIALALYPRAWRRRFGPELESMLTEMRPSPRVLADLVRGAAIEHHRRRRSLTVWLSAVAVSSALEVVALRTGVTANILWAPTSAHRAALLAITVAPLIVAGVRSAHLRRATAVR